MNADRVTIETTDGKSYVFSRWWIDKSGQWVSGVESENGKCETKVTKIPVYQVSKVIEIHE